MKAITGLMFVISIFPFSANAQEETDDFVNVGLSDPFLPFIRNQEQEENLSSGPLTSISLEQIELSGILWSEKPKGLVVVPTGNGMRSFLVKAGDAIGNQKGKVIAVLEAELIVREPSEPHHSNGYSTFRDRTLQLAMPSPQGRSPGAPEIDLKSLNSAKDLQSKSLSQKQVQSNNKTIQEVRESETRPRPIENQVEQKNRELNSNQPQDWSSGSSFQIYETRMNEGNNESNEENSSGSVETLPEQTPFQVQGGWSDFD